MAERDSWAVMDGSTRKVDAEDARLAIGALLTPGATALRGRQGLRPGPGSPGLVTASGTPDVNVRVEKFQSAITATRGLGEYIATLDADKTIDILTGNPAHATLVRNDLIIAKQSDTYYSDGSTAFSVQRVLGTAGAGDPSLTAHPDCILLARVRVAALATTITNAMIDDLRPSWVVALGGLLPVKDATDRATLTAWDGLQIYRRDRDWVEIYDGTGWRVQGIAVCTSTADRDSAITSPYNGLLAFTSDTGKVYQRAGGAWREFPAVPLAQMRQTVVQTLSNVTFSDITFTTEDFDTYNGHSTSVTTARFTAPAGMTGVFEFAGGVAFAANATGIRLTQWAKNGSALPASDAGTPSFGASAAARVAARTVQVHMVGGSDYVTLQGFQDRGGDLDTFSSGAAASSMTVKYIGS